MQQVQKSGTYRFKAQNFQLKRILDKKCKSYVQRTTFFGIRKKYNILKNRLVI